MTLKPMRSQGRITTKSLIEFKIAALHITEADPGSSSKARRFATNWLAAVPSDVRDEAVAKYVAN